MKRILALTIVVLLIISLSGCRSNDFEDFKAAIKKTEGIKKGMMSAESIVNMEFDTEGLSDEEIKDLNYIKRVETNTEVQYDDETNQVIARNYMNFGGLGFDLDYYQKDDKAFIKMPMVGKYIVISDMVEDFNSEEQDMNIEEFDNLFNSFYDKLSEIIDEENVFTGKDTILTTPDGEVKATAYSIKLENQQVKDLFNEILISISQNEEINESFKKYYPMNVDGEKIEEVTLPTIIADLQNGLDQSEISGFNYNALVDIDGFIVQEDLSFEIEFDNDGGNKAKSMKYEFKSNQWSINEKQTFDFPELTEENTLENNNIGQGMPFFFDVMMDSNNK